QCDIFQDLAMNDFEAAGTVVDVLRRDGVDIAVGPIGEQEASVRPFDHGDPVQVA
ncbi:MAG: hypothetical protein JWN14_4076, partial [Chthonomonadales bacterium]|nr:hypothetical protein [Chthonomonadales bacterium]